MAYVPVGQHLAVLLRDCLTIIYWFPWLLMGFLVGFAEPAIHVMIKQVEELSEGESDRKSC